MCQFSFYVRDSSRKAWWNTLVCSRFNPYSKSLIVISVYTGQGFFSMYTEPKIVGELLGLPGPKCLHQDLTVAEAIFSVIVELSQFTRGGLLGGVAAIVAAVALATCQVLVKAGALGTRRWCLLETREGGNCHLPKTIISTLTFGNSEKISNCRDPIFYDSYQMIIQLEN